VRCLQVEKLDAYPIVTMPVAASAITSVSVAQPISLVRLTLLDFDSTPMSLENRFELNMHPAG
jgi:hypothetical protein